MSTEYLRAEHPVEEPENAMEPHGLYLVTNVASHYFGCVVEGIDKYYRHEEDCICLWIKDSITGMWFRCTEMEMTEDYNAMDIVDPYLDDEFYNA